jgi:DNA polymerase-3 subunit alpha
MFVHLRLHTEFSVVDGTNRIDEVVKAAAADQQPALAITDLNNLFGAVKFYKQGRGKGVKPVIGAEIFMRGAGQGARRAHAHRAAGAEHAKATCTCPSCWRAPGRRTSAAASRRRPASWNGCEELQGGLIACCRARRRGRWAGRCCRAGRTRRRTGAATRGHVPAPLLHRTAARGPRRRRAARRCRRASSPRGCACRWWPRTRCSSPSAEDYEAHEARVCISEGEILGNPRRVRKFTEEQYFKSSAEMEALFADVPSALANTVEIAKRCNLTLVLGKPRLPDFPTPNGMPIDEYFRVASFEGLEERLAHLYPDAGQRDKERARYVERLEFEIKTILKMGFPGYFLIVGDFINWAKKNGCPVGPGRGSGAGSLVAYALKITDLDPLQYNLLFERFLNPERVSMPDFDIDFCQSNRDRVIDYVKDKYGRDAVSQIATFGTMAARAAIRDVGRVMDMSYTCSAMASASSFRTSRACRSRCSIRPRKRSRATRTTTPSRWSRSSRSASRRKKKCACWSSSRRSSKA